MARTIKLNGTIKVGLGSSPSGKILDRNTQCVHFYSKHEDNQNQIRKLQVALQWHRETGKCMFYAGNGRAYVEITKEWIENRINELSQF